ncbi:MAG: hypothetical protein UW92_C0003G0027 [Candidatus Jorgensenbacteria bacterium GW2011_GWA2_45_13]|uniref:Uncharacterized protein n=1 Tax=Candidatus Jorgensenbacteria bacterium GW2011_GWA2_45_13 TaxID=1618662 RepID=A0A0G1L8W2_9BACT|nr:MAG: hypothetical protein UW92_C0003G0027 [Candidatus Jorgensenbacteria bacterium GW2011_GWA2_45_13]
MKAIVVSRLKVVLIIFTMEPNNNPQPMDPQQQPVNPTQEGEDKGAEMKPAEEAPASEPMATPTEGQQA